MASPENNKSSAVKTVEIRNRGASLISAKVMGVLFYKPAAHLIIIIVLGLLAYSNTFYGPFQWDESQYILTNPVIRDLGYFMEPSRAEGLEIGFKSRYIGYLTFALNYKLHGFNVFGYHVVNLIIHLINAILVYFLVLLTFRTPFFNKAGIGDQGLGTGKGKQKPGTGDPAAVYDPQSPIPDPRPPTPAFIALAVSLLFVSHPIQTEAVTYVFQRLASLVSLFYMLSLVMYIKGRLAAVNGRVVEWSSSTIQLLNYSTTSRFTLHASRFTAAAWLILSFAAAVLAMKTKENAFTLPVVITLYEFLFFSGPLKPRLLRLVPFLLTMLIIPLTIMGSDSSAGEIISQIKDPGVLGLEGVPRHYYTLTQLRVIITYIRLLFLPVNQNLYHDYPIYRSFFTPPVLLSFLFLSSIFGAAVYLVYKSRQSAISYQQSAKGSKQPSSSQVVEELTNDPTTQQLNNSTIHYFRLIAFGILWFFITLSVESSIIPIAMVIDEYRVYLPSVGFFIAIMSGATLLVTRFTQKAPSLSHLKGGESVDTKSSPPILGGVSKGQGGKWNEVLLPDRPPLPLLNQGGELDRRFTIHASRLTKVAVAAFAVLVLILASATYARNSVWKDKISLWEDVVSKSPAFPLGYINLGLAYYEKKLYEEAIAMHTRAVELLPVYLDAYINLGVAYSAAGKTDLAIETYRKALAMYPNSNTLYFNLAYAYAVGGLPEKALENYLNSIRLDPYNPNAYHGLGTMYVRLGRLEEALEAYSKFVMFSPDNPEAYRNRGIVYSEKGDLNNARADFQKACAMGDQESCGYLEGGDK